MKNMPLAINITASTIMVSINEKPLVLLLRLFKVLLRRLSPLKPSWLHSLSLLTICIAVAKPRCCRGEPNLGFSKLRFRNFDFRRRSWGVTAKSGVAASLHGRGGVLGGQRTKGGVAAD